MKPQGIIVLVYSLLVITGGIFGFVHANSVPSLVASSIFGVLLLFSTVLIFKNKPAGLYIGLIVAFLLDAFFTYRFTATHQFMPSGLMSLLSLAVLLVLVLKIRKKA